MFPYSLTADEGLFQYATFTIEVINGANFFKRVIGNCIEEEGVETTLASLDNVMDEGANKIEIERNQATFLDVLAKKTVLLSNLHNICVFPLRENFLASVGFKKNPLNNALLSVRALHYATYYLLNIKMLTPFLNLTSIKFV